VGVGVMVGCALLPPPGMLPDMMAPAAMLPVMAMRAMM
jgi:hypothetical protein